MPTDLSDKFNRLVEDQPPSAAAPADAVVARIRTVRRRRTAGVAVLATAGVAVAALAAGTMARPNSAPPVTGTPGPTTPSAIAIPTQPVITPTGKASTPIKPSVPDPSNEVDPAGKPNDPPSNTTSAPPPTEKSTPPAAKPVKGAVSLKAEHSGRDLTLKITFSGTILAPVAAEDGKSITAGSFRDYWMGDRYTYGDGPEEGGSDSGGVSCQGATKRITGSDVVTLTKIHTYTKPGTYTIDYRTGYCGPNGYVELVRTAQVTVR